MRELSFKVNGLTLNCLDYGGESNPPILFVHGGSAHGHWWDFVAPHFTDRFHPLAIDLRGHGESEWPEEWAYGSRHYVSDLEQLIDNWSFGAPVLVGHSMGGHNVLVYATRHAEKLRAMVAIDSPPYYSELAITFLRSFAERPPRRYDSLAEAIENFRVLPRETRAEKEILGHVAHHSYKKTGEGIWTHKLDRRTLIRDPIDVWHDLGKITCPALIIKIIESQTVDMAIARKMVEILPKGKFAELRGSYHHAMLDNPGGLTAILKEFLQGIE